MEILLFPLLKNAIMEMQLDVLTAKSASAILVLLKLDLHPFALNIVGMESVPSLNNATTRGKLAALTA